MKKTILLISLIFFSINLEFLKADDLTIEDIISNYQNTFLNKKDRVAYEVEINSEFSGDLKFGPSFEKTKWLICKDGNRFDIKSERDWNYKDNSRQGNDSLHHIVDSGEYKICRFTIKKTPDYLVIDSREGELENNKNMIMASQGLSYILDGVDTGVISKSLPEIFRDKDSDLKIIGEESIDGHKTQILQAKTRFGIYKLWLDPQYDFNPRKVVVKKSIGDIRKGEPLGTEPKTLSEGAISHVPLEPITQVEIIADSIELARFGGKYFPVSATVKENIVYSSGKSIEQIDKIKRKNIDFNPDFEKLNAFVLDIPNGTEVYFKDIRGGVGIKYEWFDGEPRAIVNDNFIEQIDSKIQPIDKNKEVSDKFKNEELLKDSVIEPIFSREKIEKNKEVKQSYWFMFFIVFLVLMILICSTIAVLLYIRGNDNG